MTIELLSVSVSILVVGCVIYIVRFCLQQVWFHPYAAYPGPFIAKFTNAYAAYHAWKGDIHIDIWKCHEKYGNFVRYGPDRLAINTVDGLRDVHGQGKRFKKSDGYKPMIHQTPNTFTLIDKEVHARKRRLLKPAFTNAAIARFEPAILRQIEKFCDLLEPNVVSECSAGLNMSRWCDYLFFDLMTDVVFGQTWNMLGEATHRYVIESLSISNIRMGILVQAPALMWQRFDKKLLKHTIVARDRFVKFVHAMVGQRVSSGKNDGIDVFSLLMNGDSPSSGKGFDVKELSSEATTLVVAGSDTSATLMASLFFYLAHDPNAYRKAAAEARSAFTDAESIRLGPKLTSCVYLRGCVDEALRCSPPVGGALWRQAEVGGSIAAGVFIPEGLEVGTGIYAIHHNKDYYPDPFTYRPERWLAEPIDDHDSEIIDGGKSVKNGREIRAAATPFGLGPRQCLGRALAIEQTMLTIVKVFVRFNFEAAYPGNSIVTRKGPFGKEFQVKDHLTGSKNGPFVQFRARVA